MLTIPHASILLKEERVLETPQHLETLSSGVHNPMDEREELQEQQSLEIEHDNQQNKALVAENSLNETEGEELQDAVAELKRDQPIKGKAVTSQRRSARLKGKEPEVQPLEAPTRKRTAKKRPRGVYATSSLTKKLLPRAQFPREKTISTFLL